MALVTELGTRATAKKLPCAAPSVLRTAVPEINAPVFGGVFGVTVTL